MKLKLMIIPTAAIIAATPATSGPRYWEMPPVTVYAAPPPPPPLVQFGEVLGGIATLPFTVIGGLFGAIAQPPAPVCYDPITGQLFPCAPAMPGPPPPTYLPPPAPYPQPSYYQPSGPRKGYDAPAATGCYSGGTYTGGPGCRG